MSAVASGIVKRFSVLSGHDCILRKQKFIVSFFFKDLLYFPYSSYLSFCSFVIVFFFFSCKCYAMDLPVIFLGNLFIAQCTLMSEKFSYSTATVFALVCISEMIAYSLSLHLHLLSTYKLLMRQKFKYFSMSNDCFLYSSLSSIYLRSFCRVRSDIPRVGGDSSLFVA